MKITIDLADTQFQSTIAAAVKERIHALAADELETQMKAAVATVVGTLDKRLEAVIKNMVEEAMNYKGWNGKEALSRQLERQANKTIHDVVLQQFNILFPRATTENILPQEEEDSED
jgi:endonuclease V-like protein UPF0215 family